MRDAQINMWYWHFQNGWEFRESCPQSRSNIEAILIVLFDSEGLVSYEYTLPFQKIIKQYYT